LAGVFIVEQEEYRKLRDRFAGLALTTMAGKVNRCLEFGGDQELGKKCYRIAQALMDAKLKIECEEEKALTVRSEKGR
jgi:hypothetical protein